MVAIEPHFCHQCGAELRTRHVHGRDRKWCPACERPFFRNAVPAAGVIVRDGARVVLIERAIPAVGVWALPGGHPEYDEEPADAASRELAEETGLEIAPEDLSMLTAVHSTHRGKHYNMITYTAEYADADGELVAGDEATDVAFWDVEAALSSPNETREIDRRRLRIAFEE